MALTVNDISEFYSSKRADWLPIFQGFLSERQGGSSNNLFSQELAARAYSTSEIYQALRNERAMSISDIPVLLSAVVRTLPPAEMRLEHRQIAKFQKARDFKSFDIINGLETVEVFQTGELGSIKPTIATVSVSQTDQIKSYRSRILISRHLFVSGNEWLPGIRDALMKTMLQTEARLIYQKLESATIANTISGQADVASLPAALSAFRSLVSGNGDLRNVNPTVFVVPAGREVLEKEAARQSGLDQFIRIYGTAAVTNSYLMSDSEPCLLRIALNDWPVIEMNAPNFETDSVATADGLMDMTTAYVDTAPVVKVTL